jgi:Fe-S cluster assembly protein SufD
VELPGPDWLRAERRQAAERFEASGLPSSEQEVWRYSRIDELELDRYRPADAPGDEAEGAADLGIDDPAAEVVVVNGHPVSSSIAAPGVGLRDASGDAEPAPGAAVEPSDDAFVDLNLGFAPHPIEIEIAPGTTVEAPIVVRHTITGTDVLAAPQLTVHAGKGSQAVVIEVFESDAGTTALSVPLARLQVDQGAHLTFLTVQQLGQATWQIANQISSIGQDATLVSAAAVLGGDYARLRSDCRLEGRGASGDLLSAYFGEADQHLDFRTFQDHRAPDTTSTLLFKGAVGGHSRSVYTGLIRVRKEARGTNAFQTNRNLKLSEHAWAESVPNLEIENNDVRCSHASTVGPIDDEQRFYLESRGVPPGAAERLVVAGFFAEVLAQMPVPTLREHVRHEIAAKLDRAAEEGAIARG